MRINGGSIELLFDYMAMGQGFSVSVPRSDDAPYDRILDNGESLYKVQIKSRRASSSSVIVGLRRFSSGYTEGDFDILAVYIENNDSWYFYPFEQKRKSFRINLKNEPLNNWDIFKPSAK